MTNGQDPFDLLRETAEKPVPTPEERATALGRLQHAITTEERLDEKGSQFRWRWHRLAAIAAALAAVLVAIPVLVTDPARAALLEAAEAARLATPLEVPEGDFVFSQSEVKELRIRPGDDFGLPQDFVGYLLPAVRQVWRNPAEEFILIHTTVGSPEFFDSQTELSYYTVGLDKTDQIGENIVEQFTEADDPIIETQWPTEPEALLDTMKAFILENENQAVEPALLFDLGADILRETHPSPELRSAVLRVLSQQPLDLEEQTPDRITVSHTQDDRQVRITLSRDGHLLAETTSLLQPDPELGLPKDTILTSAKHQKTTIVDQLP